MWFKANDESMRHESGVVELLAAEVPELVPPLLADDTERGWLLMADAGEWLRSVSPREGHLDHWLEVLPAYAAAQLAMVPHVDALLALGVPDRRLPTLPAAYAALMDEIDAEPRFRAAAGQVDDLVGRLGGVRHRRDAEPRRPARRPGVRRRTAACWSWTGATPASRTPSSRCR